MATKHTADSILKTARGFMESRVLISGAQLDLFALLAENPMTAEEVATRKGADLRGATILLDVLSALGYLVKKEGRYHTEPSAVPLLTDTFPDSIRPMLLHYWTVWQTWSRITDIVLGEAEPSLRKKGALSDGHLEAFIGAMHSIASRMAPKVVATVKPGNARKLIDVGGGPATYTLAFLSAAPTMTATLFDLPPVIEIARKNVQTAAMSERVNLVPGDFYTDELPPGHDLAFLSAIIHQNSPEQNRALFEKIHRALVPGGRIVVRDHVMSPDRTRPVDGALFAVNMLAGTSGGSTYTFEEIREGLTAAGFTRVKQIQSEGMFSLVEGYQAS